MKPSFAFVVDPDRDLVRITLDGFFSPADVATFVKERDRAHQSLRCGPNKHLTLVDIRAMAIQPQDSVAAFQQMLSNPRFASRKLAFIITRSLARIQLKRAVASRGAAYFESVEDAERWLFSDEG